MDGWIHNMLIPCLQCSRHYISTDRWLYGDEALNADQSNSEETRIQERQENRHQVLQRELKKVKRKLDSVTNVLNAQTNILAALAAKNHINVREHLTHLETGEEVATEGTEETFF